MTGTPSRCPFDHEPLDLVDKLGALRRLQARGGAYAGHLTDPVRDHLEGGRFVEAVPFHQVREPHRPQLGQFLVEVHPVDQVRGPVLDGRRGIGIDWCGGHQVTWAFNSVLLAGLYGGKGLLTAERSHQSPSPTGGVAPGKKEQWQYREHDAGHNYGDVHAVPGRRARNLEQAEREHRVTVRLGEDKREQEVVPGAEAGKNADHPDYGAGQRPHQPGKKIVRSLAPSTAMAS